VKYIANIIYEQELNNHTKVDWVNYVQYEPSMHGKIISISRKLPTLVVGWNFFKREFEFFRPNILVKDSGHITWEFSMEERMTDHFNGVSNFMKISPRRYVELFPYRNVDPIKDNILNEEELLKYLGGFVNLYNCNVYQYKNEIIYLYDYTTSQITGLYLNAYKYFGFDIEKISNMIFERVRQNSNNVDTLDTHGVVYQSFYKKFPEFDQLKRSIVLFLS
jgi:hypothetical protein